MLDGWADVYDGDRERCKRAGPTLIRRPR